jgi:hypothetical protein
MEKTGLRGEVQREIAFDFDFNPKIKGTCP